MQFRTGRKILPAIYNSNAERFHWNPPNIAIGTDNSVQLVDSAEDMPRTPRRHNASHQTTRAVDVTDIPSSLAAQIDDDESTPYAMVFTPYIKIVQRLMSCASHMSYEMCVNGPSHLRRTKHSSSTIFAKCNWHRVRLHLS